MYLVHIKHEQKDKKVKKERTLKKRERLFFRANVKVRLSTK